MTVLELFRLNLSIQIFSNISVQSTVKVNKSYQAMRSYHAAYMQSLLKEYAIIFYQEFHLITLLHYALDK